MSRIWIIHSGLTGISNACLEIAHRLSADDHQLWMSSASEREWHDDELKVSSLNLNPIRFNYKDINNDWNKKSSQSKTYNSQSVFNFLIEELDFDSFNNNLSELKIDLVLIDMELHEYILNLLYNNKRFILINQWFSIWKHPYNLPPGSNLIPQPHLLGQIQRQLSWFHNGLIGSMKMIYSHFKSRGINRRNFILFLANKWNIDRKKLISYHFPLPFSWSGLPVISSTHPALEFSEHAQEAQNYIYPMVYEKRLENKAQKYTSEIDSILEELESRQKKLIVVTTTSMKGAAKKGIDDIIEALSGLENCISIISIGKNQEHMAARQVGESVHLFPFIPQLKLLSKATLSINHGGIHTINECIHYKVPMLVLSGGKFDQNGCAARVEHYGCGISLSKRNITAKDIFNALKKLLSEKNYQNSINSLNESYNAYKDRKGFETFIRNFIQNAS